VLRGLYRVVVELVALHLVLNQVLLVVGQVLQLAIRIGARHLRLLRELLCRGLFLAHVILGHVGGLLLLGAHLFLLADEGLKGCGLVTLLA
jgi:hypothetical protein